MSGSESGALSLLVGDQPIGFNGDDTPLGTRVAISDSDLHVRELGTSGPSSTVYRARQLHFYVTAIGGILCDTDTTLLANRVQSGFQDAHGRPIGCGPTGDFQSRAALATPSTVSHKAACELVDENIQHASGAWCAAAIERPPDKRKGPAGDRAPRVDHDNDFTGRKYMGSTAAQRVRQRLRYHHRVKQGGGSARPRSRHSCSRSAGCARRCSRCPWSGSEGSRRPTRSLSAGPAPISSLRRCC